MESELPARVADLLATANRRLRRASKPVFERAGITPSQLRVLRLLAAAGEPLRISELARRLDVIPRSATSVVDLLEERSLVERRPDPGDRRATLVALTPAGAEILQALRAHRAAGLAELLGRLTPQEQADLVRLLTVLTADD